MRTVPVVALLGLASLSHGQTTVPTLAIVHANVIPMTRDGLVLSDQTILISGDRITAIGSTSSTAIPRHDTRIVDGRGKFLVPGLADMHVHLEYFDDPAILGLFTANGVTTVRNMDGRPYLLDWKKRIAAGELTGPRIYTAGPLLDGNPPVRPDNTVVETGAAARAAVDAQAAAGYDFIKVYSALSTEAYEAIVGAARANRLPVAGHVPRAVGLDAVIDARQQSIEHLGDFARAIQADEAPAWSKRYLSMPVDPVGMKALATRLAKAGVWSVPTLIQPEREVLKTDDIVQHLASEEVRHIRPDGRKQWESQARRVAARLDDEDWKLVSAGRAHRLMMVNALRDAGVGLVAGSDTPNPFVVPGFSLHDELALLVEAGVSPAEALAAATREAARFAGATDWGTIEPGKAADLLLLNHNPLERVSHTRAIAGVVLRGRWIDSADRAKMLAALRKQPVVKVTASTEAGEAPRGQGATTENIGPYLKEEQRSPRGCIAGRMPS